MNNDSGHIRTWEIEEIEKVAMKAPADILTYATVFQPLLMTNPNVETGKYTVRTKSGDAEIIRRGTDFPKMKINGNEVTYSFYEIGISYAVNKDDIALAKSFGRPLNLEYVEEAVETTFNKMNSFVYRGDSQFGIGGVLELSGVTAISGTDLDTASLNLYDEVRTTMDSLPVKYRNKPYYLVVADAEDIKFNKIGNDYRNESWKKIIEDNIKNLTIIVEEQFDAGLALAGGGTIVAGTAMLIPNDKKLARLPVAKPVKSIVSKTSVQDDYLEDIEGKVKGRIGPVEVPFPTAIAKITGW